ncbi:ribonucleoside-triphosphate reductase, adenosylcobalamin-dependent [Pseudaminobacter sp. 19-2017]|uniref:Ribonucleoside-triphosphate reductase, adenosylcobalamin-dependent n=1 Tax=Pseudaminobacter soli (ex Zhang et al. 2022) TaxID=2831468 RepID=A0A942E0P2_9HYPH|nr:ribonucleoside-triphosphate reductase, adenosylcobalamin-dependent [Pseudaminobacter soli]MBS3648715.1 ribonucleoside-triphosphate reductase, adenosylcobalamin-dependent [Pseudaminobacter soli]
MANQSARAAFVEHRTYLRPAVDGGARLETKAASLDRQIGHQRYLWEEAKKAKYSYMKDAFEEVQTDIEALWSKILEIESLSRQFAGLGMEGLEDVADDLAKIPAVESELERLKHKRDAIVVAYDRLWQLTAEEEAELAELREIIRTRKGSLSGRVKWMAGTDVIRERPSAAFNCSFTDIRIPADIVDAFWLLLQGCGVGFRPQPGLLSGFGQRIEKVEFVASTRAGRGGQEKNTNTFNPETGEWRIVVGDSAKAWAKLAGTLMAKKYRAKKLVLDFSQLRPAGQRLRGYGWISSGWEPLRDGLKIIIDVMNNAAGRALDAIDILDIVNALGTVLSSRRSAQIALLDADHPDAERFAKAKDNYYPDRYWRGQSNNSLTFMRKPTIEELVRMFVSIQLSGEPGFYNMAHAKKRAPWADGCNPCAEIILPSKGFCNLVQIVMHRFNGDLPALHRAAYILARANYRQTCVSMRDGVLQTAWDDNNKLLRLCGVSPTGYVDWEYADNAEMLDGFKKVAVWAANSMADELGTPRPALVTQVQPNGTGSKAMGEDGDEIKEGAHQPKAEHIFNNVAVSIHDPLVKKALDAGYYVFDKPVGKDQQVTEKLIRFPVKYDQKGLTPVERVVNGVKETIFVDAEPAVVQLERYRTLMDHYVQHNCSITVAFEPHEVSEIVEWLDDWWDHFIGVSFLERPDVTKTAEQLGHPYLPQEVVAQSTYDAYVKNLKPLILDDDNSYDGVAIEDCATGACPVR